MIICVFPSVGLIEDQFSSGNSPQIGLNETLKHETLKISDFGACEKFHFSRLQNSVLQTSKSKILTVFGGAEIHGILENALYFLTPENQRFSRISSDNNVLTVKADYVVTVKKKVKVYYKVRTKVKVKVKVRYKSKGKWKTKYKYKYVYKYVYKYYYKYVYTSYKVRDVPPSECNGQTANAQSSDSIIKALAQSLTNSTINETQPNPDPKPTAPTSVENPAVVADPGNEPQIEDFNGNETAYQEAWDTWNNTNTSYNNYLTAKQRYDQYLQDYTHYQQSLSQYSETITVTRQLTTLEKATNIFNWVRDYVDYSFYYNTKRGAIGTLNARLGNCCDLSHLMVALSRAAGIPARYVHADCIFSSGTYGHVWAQLYVDGKWINADASNNINDFGIVRNWKTYTLKGIYSSLPF